MKRWAVILRSCVAALAIALPMESAHAFSQLMPDAPATLQGSIAARARQAARLEPRQELGAALPLDTPLRDWQGRTVPLASAFDGRPVVLVLGYYLCPNLCGVVMHGLLEALAATGLPRSEWRIAYVSVDPTETPALAASRRELWQGYMAYLQESQGRARAPIQLDTFVGDEASTRRLARAAGFSVEEDDNAHRESTAAALSRYVHPAEFMIATPEGRLSRYQFGVRFDPAQLRLALVDAGQGQVGTLADRLVLLCSHFDPGTGRYTGAVMNGVRAAGLATLAALAFFAWRHRRHGAST